ncbi:MAG: NYN domain-containing protein [Deferrisomatales bacterium]|nr:NYN domain-containing protein [Deferrisomatales bacterium]
MDGHNLIGRAPDLSLETEEEAREQLLRRLAALQGRGRQRVVAVFDGNRPGAAKESSFGGVRVVFSPRGRTADEEILRRLARGRPGDATVVTSDRGLAERARRLGARVESAEHFLPRLKPAPGRRRAPPSEASLSPEEVERWLRLFRGGHNM